MIIRFLCDRAANAGQGERMASVYPAVNTQQPMPAIHPSIPLLALHRNGKTPLECRGNASTVSSYEPNHRSRQPEIVNKGTGNAERN